jgi:putative ubiquitin-RnfH superfamily antitoxin RatB of RatAB toxin-antitoxin module
MIESNRRELEWLENEVRQAASLSDADRIRILRDLLRTADSIRREKSPEELERDEEVRRILNDLPGRERYAALAERLE